MPEKLEVVNLLKKPLDAKVLMDKLSEALPIKPITVAVDNSNYLITIEFPQKPDKKLIQEVEKILRVKEVVEGGEGK